MDHLKKKVVLLFLLSLTGFCLFMTNAIHFRQITVMKPEDIKFLRGILISDPRKTRGQDYSFQLYLSEAGNSNGIFGNAAGTVTVIGHNKNLSSLLKGDKVTLRSIRLLRSKSADDSMVFTGRTDFVRERSPWPLELIRSFRLRSLGFLYRLISTEKSWPGLFIAMSTGYQDDLSPELKEAFTKTGCSHLLALSGFNLGIITGFMGFFLSKAIPRGRWFPLTIPVLVVYLAVTGMPPSLTRAFIFFLLLRLFSALKTPLKPDPLVLLFISLVLQSIFFPLDLLTLSCRISYLAMAGLLAFSAPYSSFFKTFMPRQAADILAVTFSAQSTVIPYIQYIFGKTTSLGLLVSPLLQLLVLIFFQTGMIHLLFRIIPGPFPDGLTDTIQQYLYSCTRMLVTRIPTLFEKLSISMEYTSWAGCFFLMTVIFIPLAGWILILFSNRSITTLPRPYGNFLIQDSSPSIHDMDRTS
jgi:ComEC/Rec2-related protein